MSIIYFLLIGLAAGWLAGQITKGSGFGTVENLVIGVIGAVLGGFIFGLLGLTAYGLLGNLVTATVGAIALLMILRAIKKK
ncbi:MAG TPA: GlsB/YeaQ/YmgE family stress response membrane protein [Phycisphaerae bacterium]|nr:GlsB/YeaQ/YmgE family stress response membrane protein [Phycisphaerales bacterium]HNO76738.1 GlsB/YeaQ/YmgE family stress response membrane protein [Phycisphaerae bacterium]